MGFILRTPSHFTPLPLIADFDVGNGLAVLFLQSGAWYEKFALSLFDHYVRASREIGDEFRVGTIDLYPDRYIADIRTLPPAAGSKSANAVHLAVKLHAWKSIEFDDRVLADAERAALRLIDGAFHLHGLGID